MRDKSFYKLLFGKISFPFFIVVGVALIYVLLMSFIDHSLLPFPEIIVVLASVKTFIIALTTLKQLSKLIRISHTFERLLVVFGFLICMSIFSFATDYTCLYQFEHSSFQGIPVNSDAYISSLYHFIYFSTITFSTLGYGDIAPVSGIAKFVVMLEIFSSFFIVVFGLANIKILNKNE